MGKNYRYEANADKEYLKNLAKKLAFYLEVKPSEIKRTMELLQFLFQEYPPARNFMVRFRKTDVTVIGRAYINRTLGVFSSYLKSVANCKVMRKYTKQELWYFVTTHNYVKSVKTPTLMLKIKLKPLLTRTVMDLIQKICESTINTGNRRHLQDAEKAVCEIL